MATPAYTLVSGPVEEPVSRTQAKLWLKIEPDVTVEDNLIDDLIREARARAERVTGRVLCTQTWRLTLDCFPFDESQTIYVDLPPLVTVASIIYTAVDGTETTLSTTVYQVDTDSKPGRIAPYLGKVWPASKWQMNAVRIQFTAGVSAATVDPEFLGKMRSVISYCYRNRGDEGYDEANLDKRFESLWCGTY